MFKRLFVITAAVVLTGCATHQQSNQALGAIVGGAVGHHAIGGPAGTAIGAMVGGAIGGNQPTQQRYHSPVYSAPSIYPDYSVCADFWNWQERQACQRGVETRARQEQNQRNAEAYRRGLGR
jgi:hypothetical protein